LTAGELVEVFKGTEAYTVFAPTNDAFAAVQSTVDMLLKAENKSKLQNVLKYHVVAGTVKAADLKDGQELVRFLSMYHMYSTVIFMIKPADNGTKQPWGKFQGFVTYTPWTEEQRRHYCHRHYRN
jgi:hypothetical protein